MLNLKLRLRQGLPFLLSGLAGALLFCNRFGVGIVNPRHVDWLLIGEDTSMFQLGWQFFRNEAWTYPLGRIYDYLAPVGSSIALTDSIPLLAIPLKLVSGLLPTSFQYLGFYLMMNYVLMGVFGYLLVRDLTPCRRQRALGVALLLLTPPFLQRWGHIALSSHWIVLWALWNSLRTPLPSRPRSWFLRWLPIWLVAAAIHPYLVIMVAGLTVAHGVRVVVIDRSIDGRHALGGLLLLVLALLLVWHAAGYFVFSDAFAPGNAPIYTFSMNINAAWNPMATSTLLRDLPTNWGQYEGYGYLGAGLLLLSLVALALLPMAGHDRRRSLRHLPLAIVVVGLTIFALSNRLTLGDRIVYEYTYPDFIRPAVETVRAMGRFFWPAFYAWLLLVFWAMCRFLPTRAAVVLLLVAVLLQAIDVKPLYGRLSRFVDPVYTSRLDDDFWDQAMAGTARIVTYPPQRHTTQYQADFRDLALLAAAHDAEIWAGYATRYSRREYHDLPELVRRQLVSPEPDPRALYIIATTALPGLWDELSDQLQVTWVDGYVVAISRAAGFEVERELKERPMSLAEFFARNREQLVCVTVKDEATRGLSAAERQVFNVQGAHFDQIAYRGSYIGLFRNGKVLVEDMSADHAVSISLSRGQSLGALTLTADLEVLSAGFLQGNRAWVAVNGETICNGKRGLNLVVFDSDLSPIEIAQCDTYIGGPVLVFETPGR